MLWLFISMPYFTKSEMFVIEMFVGNSVESIYSSASHMQFTVRDTRWRCCFMNGSEKSMERMVLRISVLPTSFSPGRYSSVDPCTGSMMHHLLIPEKATQANFISLRSLSWWLGWLLIIRCVTTATPTMKPVSAEKTTTWCCGYLLFF